ncbi:MAG: hypothetical protein NXI20_28415 [bacterium]|nr:hypothetical protein [bacterium]
MSKDNKVPLNVRVSRKLREQVQEAAKQEVRSFTNFVEYSLQKSVDQVLNNDTDDDKSKTITE